MVADNYSHLKQSQVDEVVTAEDSQLTGATERTAERRTKKLAEN